MPSIYSYQKHITAEITREILLPADSAHHRLGTELATIDGITYISLPDGVDLPSDQPSEIAMSIEPVTLTPLLTEQIKNASPHVRLINQQVAEKIGASYSLADEIKLLRTAPSAEFESYNAHAESCRQWGREQKSSRGLESCRISSWRYSRSCYSLVPSHPG